MGSVGSTDNSFNHIHQRQCGNLAAVHQGKLPKISAADAWHSWSELLLGLESINELCPKKYSTEGTNDGHCISCRI